MANLEAANSLSANTIRLGPVHFPGKVCVGFCVAGFLWSLFVNLYAYGQNLLSQPTVVGALAFWVVAIVAVWLLDDLGDRFDAVLNRLWNRGVLSMTEEELVGFKKNILGKANIAAIVIGIAMLLLVVTFYAVAAFAYGRKPDMHAMVQYPFEVGAAFIGGLYMGRTIVHAFVGNLLQRKQHPLKIMPGHPDGAAGVTPIGELFLRQAVVMLLPAVYFVLGWSLLSVAKTSQSELFDPLIWQQSHDDWAAIFLAMFFVMMALQLLGFFAPMWLFHLEMKKQKDEQLVVADELSSRITQVKASLADEEDENQIRLFKERLGEMTARHTEIEHLPTWPLSLSVRRRFAINNFLVTLPVLFAIWQEVSKLLFSN